MKNLLKKRTALLVTLIVVVGLLAVGFAAHMAMAIEHEATVTISLTVPDVLELTGLESFIIAGSTPGTYTGSDPFTVTTNSATGANVSGVCASFTGIVAVPITTYVDDISIGPGTFNPTVTVTVEVVLADAPGARAASLTVTAAVNI